MTDGDARLDAVRREIDALDAALLDLLSRRGRAVLEVAAIKRGETEPRFYRPERETAMLRRLAAINEGPLPDREVRRLFREIVSTCRAIEYRLVIGCASVGGACAAVRFFGGAVDIHAVPDTGTVLGAVADARCDYAVIEFSDAGEAPCSVMDFPARGLMVCGEWHAWGAERYVVVGRTAVPPTGDDWTALVVPVHRVAFIESWCGDSNLAMRATPIARRASSTFVEVALHMDEPRFAPLVSECGGVVVGAYPNAAAAGGGRALE